MSRLRVLQIPETCAWNDYVQLQESHLTALGIDVLRPELCRDEPGFTPGDVSRLARGAPDVVHMHWPEMLGRLLGGSRAHRYKAGYDAAKAAAESLTRSFALEYGPCGISTRAIAIGPIGDSSTTSADGGHLDALVRNVPLQRYATLTEVVNAVAALGSPIFDFANGATYTFDGGLAQQLRPADIERPPDS